MAEQNGDLKPLPQWGRRYNSDSQTDSPWARKVILSLDGGGVKGYSSLLILEQLMDEIKRFERGETRDFDKVESSMSCSWSECVTDPEDTDFFMHHYVDYFVGTSTGGLTAIMLGRLKMTISQAVDQYYEVGKHVFKRPRKRGRGKLGQINDRLDGTYMDETLKKATVTLQMQQRERIAARERAAAGEAAPATSAKETEKSLRRQIDYHAQGIRMRNPGSDSARTVVVACTMSKREPYLFRSYDHPYPNPALPGNELVLHLNAGPAQDVALWKAGRATSAAPGWFPSIKIGKQRFQDGAVAKYNNPIDAAFNEVKQMLANQEPSVIISVGTGVKQSTQGSLHDADESPSKWTWIKESIAQYKALLGNSDLVHQAFKTRLDKEYRHSPAKKPAYFRWDVPTGFPKVRLGDWHGDDGLLTREAISKPTKAYYDSQTVRQEIKDCAKRLVEIRRRRAETARWETFALDARLYYVCPLSLPTAAGRAETKSISDGAAPPNTAHGSNEDCKDLRFDSRISLRQHAIDCHGYVWRLRCGHFPRDHTANQSNENMAPRSHIEWSCIWDHCEAEISAFDEESDLRRHLRSVHGHANPQVHRDHREFEEWLDLGRNVDSPGKASLSPKGTFQRMATWESRVA